MALINKIINIADAIREKTNTTSKLTLDEMVDAIDNITTGFPNGRTWTQSNIKSGTFKEVEYAKGVWVAVSESNGIYYSIDGKTWQLSNITSGTFYGSGKILKNGNGIWVVCSGSGNNGIYYSIDGKTWTQSNITSEYYHGLTFVDGIWVVCCDGNGLYYSIDGKTWIQSNLTTGSFNLISNIDGVWYVGYQTTYVGAYTSTDGKVWTEGSAYMPCNILKFNDIWVAGAPNTEGISYSTDGTTWTQSNVTVGRLNGIVNVKDLLVAYIVPKTASSDKRYGTYYSIDGKTWTQSNITYSSVEFVVNNGGICVTGFGMGKGLYYSIDGIEWVQSNITRGQYCTAMNADGVWVAGGKGVGLYYSITWEPSEELLGGV